MRLHKLMAERGIASRRQCETYINEGRVTVNGVKAEIGCVVDEEQDEILFDGKVLEEKQKQIVLLFYKPRGVICTSSDPKGRKTVQAYFTGFKERLYNVGRLDINSEGLLVMTNDGVITKCLTHPGFKVEKAYYAVCDNTLTSEEASLLRKGIMLDDGITLPAKVENIRPTKTGQSSFIIKIREGRNRQVRRMIQALGHKTLLLKRESIGLLTLKGLKPGEWRYATNEEMVWLHSLVDRYNN